MKKILNAPFMRDMRRATANMYRLGWDERNGGNISILLEESELSKYLKLSRVLRRLETGFQARELVGRYFLITGTGKYFKNVEEDPAHNLGIIRIAGEGETAELLWGFEGGGTFTSELPAHLMVHAERLKADKGHRVVMHTHPTYTIAMNAVCPADEKEFTHRLWSSNTEAIVVFPDGVGILPCMVCGTYEIGRATADKMKEYRLVVWTNHGIYGTGKDMDEAFGLIETVEKTAQLYMFSYGKAVNVIPDEILKGLALRYAVEPKSGILS